VWSRRRVGLLGRGRGAGGTISYIRSVASLGRMPNPARGCACVCMRVCVCVCVRARARVCMRMYMCAHMCACARICARVFARKCVVLFSCCQYTCPILFLPPRIQPPLSPTFSPTLLPILLPTHQPFLPHTFPHTLPHTLPLSFCCSLSPSLPSSLPLFLLPFLTHSLSPLERAMSVEEVKLEGTPCLRCPKGLPLNGAVISWLARVPDNSRSLFERPGLDGTKTPDTLAAPTVDDEGQCDGIDACKGAALNLVANECAACCC